MKANNSVDRGNSRVVTTMRKRVGAWLVAYSNPLGLLLVNRAGLFLLVYLSLILIPLRAELPWRAFPDNLLIDGWLRWDSGWYYDIAEHGYDNLPQNEQGQRDTAFFPLYPLVVRGVKVFTGNTFLAGLLVANIAFLIAGLLLFRLISDEFGEVIASRSIILLSVFPFSFYFSAMYSEALFLLAVVCAFYFGKKGKWGFAALGAAAAGATRLVGIMTIIGLIFVYLEGISFNWRKIRFNALWVPAGLLGPLGFMVYLGIRFGDPLQFWKSQYVAGWGADARIGEAWRTIAASLSPGALLAGSYPTLNLIHLVTFAAALVLSIYAWFRLSKAYAAWSLLTLLASFTLWRSMGRYVAVLFPVFVAAAIILPRRWFHIAAYFSTLLLGLLAVIFAHFLWVS